MVYTVLIGISVRFGVIIATAEVVSDSALLSARTFVTVNISVLSASAERGEIKSLYLVRAVPRAAAGRFIAAGRTNGSIGVTVITVAVGNLEGVFIGVLSGVQATANEIVHLNSHAVNIRRIRLYPVYVTSVIFVVSVANKSELASLAINVIQVVIYVIFIGEAIVPCIIFTVSEAVINSAFLSARTRITGNVRSVSANAESGKIDSLYLVCPVPRAAAGRFIAADRTNRSISVTVVTVTVGNLKGVFIYVCGIMAFGLHVINYNSVALGNISNCMIYRIAAVFYSISLAGYGKSAIVAYHILDAVSHTVLIHCILILDLEITPIIAVTKAVLLTARTGVIADPTAARTVKRKIYFIILGRVIVAESYL